MGSKTMDEMMKEVGSFGRFQILLLFLSLACIPMTAWSMLFMVFGAVEPDWWCESHGQQDISMVHILNKSLKDATYASGSDAVLDLTTTDGVWRNNDSDLQQANSSWKFCGASDGSNGVCERIVFASGMDTLVSKYDVSAHWQSVSTTPHQSGPSQEDESDLCLKAYTKFQRAYEVLKCVRFQLVCGLSWVSPMIISLQMVGVLIGACVSGIASDGIGRKKTLVAIVAFHAVTNLIAAFSVSWQMFAVLRTLIGVSIGGLFTTAFSYPTEFVGIKWRAIVGTIPLWGIGSLSYSLLVWVLPHWSYQHIATAACMAANLPAWLFLPESVRWLSVKGRMTEAHAVLVKIAKWNRRTPPTLQSVQELCLESDSTQKKYHYLHLFSSWKLVKMSVLHGWLWFSCSLTYYGISFGIKNMSGNFYMNFFLMSVFEVWPTLLVYPLSNRFGRRWPLFGGLLLTMMSTLAVVPISVLMSAEEGGTYINALCTASRSTLNFSWSVMTVFLAEHYPTVVRNIASGYANTITRFGGILAPYILSIGEPYVFYIIISAVIALSCLTPLLTHETKGQPLSDELPPTFWKEKSERKNGFELVKVTDT